MASFYDQLKAQPNYADNAPLTIEPIKEGVYKAQITEFLPVTKSKSGLDMQVTSFQFAEPVKRRAPVGRANGVEVALDPKHEEKDYLVLDLVEGRRAWYERDGKNPEESHVKDITRAQRRIFASVLGEEAGDKLMADVVAGKVKPESLPEKLVGKPVYIQVKYGKEKDGEVQVNYYFIEKWKYEAKKAA